MLKLPFNPELPSALTPERIDELNSLSLKAQIEDEGSISGNKVDENYLAIETCAMQEVHSNLSDFDTHSHFYNNINTAFALLIEKRPNERDSIFTTYQDLNTLSELFKLEGCLSIRSGAR